MRENSRALLMGHSIVANAYNDQIIDGVQNFAQEGESYFYTYIKLKKILDTSSIDKVFLDVSPNCFAVNFDDHIWGDNFLNGFLPRYLPFMTLEEYLLLIKNNPAGTVKISLKSLIKWIYIYTNKFSYDSRLIGGFLPRNGQLDCANVDNRTFKLDFASTNSYYLEKLVNLAEEREIEIYFIETPFSELSSWNDLRRPVREFLNKKFSEIKIVQFQDLTDLSCGHFWDFNHMNKTGSKYFSEIVDMHLLKKGVLP